MANDQDVVIVDASGTEHIFPAGFDPKRAADIVRQRTTGPAPGAPSASGMASMMGAHPVGSFVTSEGEPSTVQKLHRFVNEMSLTNPVEPDIVPELRPLGPVIRVASRLLPFVASGSGQASNAVAETIAPAAESTVRAGARGAGNLLTAVGEKGGWPIRMMGAHQLGSGNPLGVAVMAVPEALKKAGSALKAVGEDPARVAQDAERMLQRGGAPVPPSSIVRIAPKDYYEVAKQNAATNPVVAREVARAETQGWTLRAREEQQAAKAQTGYMTEAAKAQANTDRLAEIERTKAGRTAGTPSVRDTLSAETPGGGRTSMSTSYKAPNAAERPTAVAGMPSDADLLAAGVDPSRVVSSAPGITKRAVRLPSHLTPSAEDTFQRATNTGRYAANRTPAPLSEIGIGDVTGRMPVSQSKSLSDLVPGGLSVNDVKEVGDILAKNPAATADEIAKQLLSRRSGRSSLYRETARLDKEPE